MPMNKRLTALLYLFLCFFLPAPGSGEAPEALFSLQDLSLKDAADAERIALSGQSLSLSGSGTYVLSGEIQDGAISVTVEEDDLLYLLLDGVTVSNSKGPALCIEGDGKVIVTLCKESVNTLIQGVAEPEGKHSSAAVFSKGPLTLNGSGALIINGNYKDGIDCRDELRIVSGTIAITAFQDALTGKKGVTIGGGNLTAVSETGDAVKAAGNKNDPGCITICGGILSLTTGQGAQSAAFQAGAPDSIAPAAQASASEPGRSQKGLTAKGTIIISAGSIQADTAADCIHARDVLIQGGILALSSGDDAVHAEHSLTLSGGEVTIERAYEGLEAAQIYLHDGLVSITAFDDGINGAGGDSSSEAGSTALGASLTPFSPSSSTGSLFISGGTYTVISDGDGVDINGDIEMSGGTLFVRGAQNSMNAAVDYDGTFTMTGGTLLALGMSGMAQDISDPSVPGAMLDLSGGAVSICDESGNELFSFSPDGAYDSAVVYSEAFANGGTYLLSTGDEVRSFTAAAGSVSRRSGPPADSAGVPEQSQKAAPEPDNP